MFVAYLSMYVCTGTMNLGPRKDNQNQIGTNKKENFKKRQVIITRGMLCQSFKAVGWMVWLQSQRHTYPHFYKHPAELR